MKIIKDTDEYEIVEFALGEDLPHNLVRVIDDTRWGTLQRLVLDSSSPNSDISVYAKYIPEAEKRT